MIIIIHLSRTITHFLITYCRSLLLTTSHLLTHYHPLSLTSTHSHSKRLVTPSLIVTHCHSLSFTVTHCHSLLLITTLNLLPPHSLSSIATHCQLVTPSLIVTRCNPLFLTTSRPHHSFSLIIALNWSPPPFFITHYHSILPHCDPFSLIFAHN